MACSPVRVMHGAPAGWRKEDADAYRAGGAAGLTPGLAVVPAVPPPAAGGACGLPALPPDGPVCPPPPEPWPVVLGCCPFGCGLCAGALAGCAACDASGTAAICCGVSGRDSP